MAALWLFIDIWIHLTRANLNNLSIYQHPIHIAYLLFRQMSAWDYRRAKRMTNAELSNLVNQKARAESGRKVFGILYAKKCDEVSTLNGIVARLEEELRDAVTKGEKLAQDQEKSELENTRRSKELEQKLSDSLRSNENHDSASSKVMKENAALKKEAEQQKYRAGQADKASLKKQKSVESLESQVENLVGKKKLLESKVEEMKKEGLQKKEAMDNLEREAADAKGLQMANSYLESQLEKMEAEKAQLKADLAAAHKLRVAIQDNARDTEAFVQLQVEKIKGLKAEKSGLENALDRLQEAKSQAGQRVDTESPSSAQQLSPVEEEPPAAPSATSTQPPPPPPPSTSAQPDPPPSLNASTTPFVPAGPVNPAPALPSDAQPVAQPRHKGASALRRAEKRKHLQWKKVEG